MVRYPDISDHGLIGDLQTAALVTTDGTLDWFCCPRFDSPSVFASLLDAGRGGHFRIAPDRDDYVSRQLYLPDTAILVTRFMTPDGVGEVHDFMAIAGGAATGRHRLVRNIRVVRGVMRFAIEIQPRFDYGRKPHQVDLSEYGGVFASDGLELTVHGIAPEGTVCQGPGNHAGARRRRAALDADPAGGRDRRRGAGVDGGHAAPGLARGGAAAGGRHRAVLALVAAPFHLRRPVAGDGRPLRHDAEAADLRAHRRPGRRSHGRAARAGRRGAQLGLPLHLDPGRLLLHLRAAGPGLRGGSSRIRRLAAGPRRSAGR